MQSFSEKKGHGMKARRKLEGNKKTKMDVDDKTTEKETQKELEETKSQDDPNLPNVFCGFLDPTLVH